MKSGMFMAEVVKRLFRSDRLKRLVPNREAQLRHIFGKQVYGLAPTEIIYRIVTNYILGFSEGGESLKHNFRQLDALLYAKDGTLKRKLDEMFGGRSKGK